MRIRGHYVERLAREKAAAVPAAPAMSCWRPTPRSPSAGEILGKPVDAADARRMLLPLSGPDPRRAHRRWPCGRPAATRHAVVTTSVTMVDDLAEDDIDWYVATGEPLDKAGAYALQGAGGLFVRVRRGQRQQRRRPAAGAELAELLAAAGWPLERLRHARSADRPDLRFRSGSRRSQRRSATRTHGWPSDADRYPFDRRWRSSSPSRR